MKRLAVVLIACFVAGICFVIVPSAIADKPPAPPGQGECNHGNSNQPCKPDPSTNGKDCDPHGNNGGVNEDHCLGTTTTTPSTTTTTTTRETTSTTETTQTHQTTSTQTATSPNQTTSTSAGQSPQTGTTTPTEVQTTTTTSATPSPDAAPPIKVKAKAKAKAKAQGKLPFTGFKLWMAFVLGGTMLTIGLALRRRTD